MHMFRHHHITSKRELVPHSNFRQRFNENISGTRRSQQRQSLVATESDKMQMTASVVTLQTFRHNSTPRPTRNPDAWGTHRDFIHITYYDGIQVERFYK